MPRKPLPPDVLELRGAYQRHPERRPVNPGEQPFPVTRLAEARAGVAQPCPASVRDPRGVKLWEETCARMAEIGTLTRELLPALERYVLFTVQMWKAVDAGKPIRAALNRELSVLEARLLATATADRSRPANVRRPRLEGRFRRFAPENDADDALRRADPQAWREKCRKAAAESVALGEWLRARPDERRRLLARKARNDP